jgi:hypothetical protein
MPSRSKFWFFPAKRQHHIDLAWKPAPKPFNQNMKEMETCMETAGKEI